MYEMLQLRTLEITKHNEWRELGSSKQRVYKSQ